jgi:adenosylcobinamide-phosphate synthase
MGGWIAALRDAMKHPPKDGWREATMAGALNFSLGGPRAYSGEVHDLPEFAPAAAIAAPRISSGRWISIR